MIFAAEKESLPHATIDRSRLRLAVADPAEETTVLEWFLTAAEEKLYLFRESGEHVSARWFEGLHFLKGSAANLGMEALAECCRAAEAHYPSPKEKEQRIAAIQKELARIRAVAFKPIQPR